MKGMEFRIGIDLGGTGIKTGLVDAEGRIVSRVSRPTDAARGPKAVVLDMAQSAREAAETAGLSLADVSSAGIGTPGCVNPRTGELLFSNNLFWRNVRLRELLEDALGLPVGIGNDANCAILGELLAGAAKHAGSALMLTLGTGVGSGVVLDGKLFCGGDGTGPELGHTPFIFNGEPCTCGVNGCLESYASVTALIRQTKAAMDTHPGSAMHAYTAERGGHVSGRTAFDCARQFDAAALAVVDQYIEYVAGGVGGFVNAFRPELVIIGGGISHEGETLLGPLRDKLPRYVYAGDLIPVPPIVRALLENDAGIIGAAFLDRK